MGEKISAGNCYPQNKASWPSHPSCFLPLTGGWFSPTVRTLPPTPTPVSHIQKQLPFSYLEGRNLSYLAASWSGISERKWLVMTDYRILTDN